MNRRDFMSWVGVGVLGSSLPVAIAACTSQPSTPTTSSGGSGSEATGGFEVLGGVSDLDQAGQILNKDLAAGPVLAIRDPGNAEAVIAVNPLCPHAGCDVEWKAEETAFVCPCHQSKFKPDGSIIGGPTKEPLKTYEAKIEGDQILVKPV